MVFVASANNVEEWHGAIESIFLRGLIAILTFNDEPGLCEIRVLQKR